MTRTSLRSAGVFGAIAVISFVVWTASRLGDAWAQFRGLTGSLSVAAVVASSEASSDALDAVERYPSAVVSASESDIGQSAIGIPAGTGFSDFEGEIVGTRPIPETGRLTMDPTTFSFDGEESALEKAVTELISSPDQQTSQDAYEFLKPYLYP